MENIYLEEIPLNKISPDSDQPRYLLYLIEELKEKAQEGDKRLRGIWESLSSLASSILEVGLQQPITVYPNEDGDGYKIYDGHRRWLAMMLLDSQGEGNGMIPCYVRPRLEDEDNTLLGQLNINFQREDFNVFEVARSLEQVRNHLRKNGGNVRIMDEDGSIHIEELEPKAPDKEIWSAIEKMLGISQSRRYQIQAVLKLPKDIQKLAEEMGISESRLRYIIPIKDKKIQKKAIKEVLALDISNAEIRRRIEKLQKSANELLPSPMPKPMRIMSAIRPVQKLSKELAEVKNVPAAIGSKDPRTVESYRKLLPELRQAMKDLEDVLGNLEYLEAE